ncbi:nitrate- and nitrite sensing domain-containing protein [Streptomyces sp. NPDC091292]|uniref:sensor histidine kinase n=1 Tax=Streptomyces sp. NPDC091292 TaxID=3365991 RepID=UPI0037F30552
MRFRGKSIRRKIVALLLVPLVSLTALWGFATVLTGQQAYRLLSVARVVDRIGYPVEDTVRTIQQERRESLAYLADPRGSDALSDLRDTRTRTDALVAKIRSAAEDSGLRGEMDTESRSHLTSLLDALDGIYALRRTVEDGTVTRATALDLYNRLVDPCYAFLLTLQGLDNAEMDKQGRALVGLSRARELLSREDALYGSALVVSRLTRDEIRGISDLVAQRNLLYEVNLAMLPDDERERFERYWKSADTTPLRVAEAAVGDAAPGPTSGLDAGDWSSATSQVLNGLGDLNTAASDHYQDRVHPIAVGVIVRAVVAGVLGLIALLVSLVLSVRVGRGLIRDLRRMRLEAHEASGVRLPGVMRRLAAGEQVDVETESPRLDYGKDEIGQVGQALNTLQRAAVEATVKQAELRQGVSEVFVNLARRSQVLLHKQLTLLDSMERRTEDTDELADLFRLDHLTTRMRRHAEGLVILSGAAPSRQWRKPVQLMDVVRASVAEVEDYERIEVRRLPRLAITGPAVADITHLVAELLENATVFSPPHTAVQVHGERVANGFTLEIHDRGLGMAADALLDANLRLAETPEFELSDTDRLGLFVVSRLAQRQNVRVSLQPSPYGGTTAVVFIPDALLTDASDTDGTGLRVDRALVEAGDFGGADTDRAATLTQTPVTLPGLPASVLDGPVELEAAIGPVDDLDAFPGAPGDDDGERGGLFRPRRSVSAVPREQHQQTPDAHETPDQHSRPDGADTPDGPVPLPRRRAPKLVSSHGRPVADPTGDDREPAVSLERDRDRDRDRADGRAESGVPDLPRRRRFNDPPARNGTGTRAGDASGDDADSDALPRRVRQANLAPQLMEGPARRTEREAARQGPEDRDADEVRSRMASLQRGWRRGREENAVGDDAQDGTAQRTTSEGDGR